MSDIKHMVELYIKLRDKKAVAKKAFEVKMAPLNEAMADLENAMLDEMNKTGVDSFKTEAGTCYRSTRTNAGVADWDMLWDYVLKHGAPELIERRVSKAACQEFRDTHGELPPGVNWREEATVNFRKS